MDKIRNEVHQRDRWFRKNTREARLWWFGHVRRKDIGYIGSMLRMELPGKRKRGKPRRFMDALREDMADDRTKCRWKIRCGDLDGRRRKKRIQLLSFNNFSKMRSALHTSDILSVMEMTTYKTGRDVWSRMVGS